MSDMDELGSGQIEYTPGRIIVHFGSPPGTTYHPAQVRHPVKDVPLNRAPREPKR